MTSPAPSATGARSPKTGSLDDEKRDSIGVDVLVTLDRGGPEEAPAFRLYKRRFAGLVGLVRFSGSCISTSELRRARAVPLECRRWYGLAMVSLHAMSRGLNLEPVAT